uniref:ZSWIM1/3 RNaseH-like domain-containing protein n=1 Tax=Schizaphis graminum TaxID=13262 RepID=A0A2S2NX01_SCHGA
MGVPVQRILNDVRDSATGKEIQRIHLLEKKDLHNIRRDFNITYSTKHHENDAVSVKLWVDRMKSKDDHSPILYFKPQGEIDLNVPHFIENDFCLIIMTQYQSEMLVQFGNDKICIDGTHGLNSYNFQLYTIVVIDEYGNGYPVAFCFSNKSDIIVLKNENIDQ